MLWGPSNFLYGFYFEDRTLSDSLAGVAEYDELRRRLFRTNSQAWKDRVELSRWFLKAKDQYTESEAKLQSPALAYTLGKLEKVAGAEGNLGQVGEVEKRPCDCPDRALPPDIAKKSNEITREFTD